MKADLGSMEPAEEARATARRERPRRLNSKAVAAAAGVSQATVSNVLNRPEVVAPATYRRVMTVIESLGFVLNRSARDLRNGRGSALGIIVLDVSNPFWGELVRGAEEVATQLGRPVIVCSSDGSPDKEERFLHLLESYQVDCILLAAADTSAPSLQALRHRGTGLVFLENAATAGGVPAVGADDVEGGRLAARHLLEMGHRQVLFLNGPHSIASCRDRAQGFLEVFAEEGAGVEVIETTVPTMTARDGLHASKDVRGLHPQVSAVFCANDVLALGLLQGLVGQGIQVPEQISIMGYDDSDFAALLSPALTTVHIDPLEIGRRAAQAAFNPEEGLEQGSCSLLPALVERESVRRLEPQHGGGNPRSMD